jgi:hypothetical protein
MPDPKTLLAKLAETAQAVNSINPLGAIPNDLTAANLTDKTPPAGNNSQQTYTAKPIPPAGK